MLASDFPRKRYVVHVDVRCKEDFRWRLRPYSAFADYHSSVML